MLPWQEKAGGIPPTPDAESVARREDLRELDPWPSEPRFPVVGREERPTPWIAATRIPVPVRDGHPMRDDDEDERQGVCTRFLFGAPRRGWRTVFVRNRRTHVDGAECGRVVRDRSDPTALRVRGVQENVNPPPIGARDEAVAPAEARRLARRLAIPPTPVPGRWRNLAETGLTPLEGPGLERRRDATEVVRKEAVAWAARRTEAQVTIKWRFTVADARVKRKSVYPSIKN